MQTSDSDHYSITQLTQAQAIACAKEQQWKDWDLPTRALFQIHQDRLCMPFDVFHQAVRETLGRPVFTHEYGSRERLKAELMGLANAPTLDEIIALLPQDRTIVISI